MTGKATFDTFSAPRALQGTGMDAAQAEAVGKAIGAAVGSSSVPTRADLAALRAERPRAHQDFRRG